MKFLCPNCKAKYQISDEKIVGRTLKMDCRRCSHPIVIRGDKLAAEPEPAAKPASRPGSGSHVGPAPASRQSSRTALGADFRKNAGAGAPAAKPTALDQWHVAIHDVPVGPMKRDEVAQKIGAGAVTGESLCWREGFDDWRPLKEVPELAELLRRAAAPPPSRALPRAAPPGAPRPARPPAQRLPSQSAPSSRPAEPARPAARGNVVPIGGRLGAAAAPAVEDFSEDMPDDEPTRVGSSLDLIRAEEERAAEEARERKEQQRKDEEATRARHAEEAARRDAAEREAAAARAPAAAFAEEDAFDPFASQRAPLEVGPAAPAGPAFAAPTQPLPPSASYAAPLSEAPPRRRGLPVGAWIAIAGAMAFGATLAVMFGIKLFAEPSAPVAVTAPTPSEPTGPTEAQPDPTLAEPTTPDPVADPPVAEDPEATDPTPTAPANSGGTRPPREGSSPATPREPTSPTNPSRPLDPEAAARLAQFEDDGAGAAPINVRDRNNPLDEGTRRGTGELSQEQIRAVVNRERSTVQRCYETATRAAGQSPSMRIDVDLTVGASGTVTSATARGPGFGSLTDCIERTVRRWRFPASGGSSPVSIPFVFQGQD